MKNAGLWIDHKKAVIVLLTGGREEIRLVHSKVKRHHRQTGVSIPADDIRLREFTEHINIYYEEVISIIHNTQSILVFGPGEAKDELKNWLEKDGLGTRLLENETADKMIDPQIVAKVKKHFLH